MIELIARCASCGLGYRADSRSSLLSHDCICGGQLSADFIEMLREAVTLQDARPLDQLIADIKRLVEPPLQND